MSFGLSAISVIPPIWISAPGATGNVGTRAPSRNTPFLLSRSASTHPSMPCVRTAWVLEMLPFGSHNRNQQSLDAPIVDATCFGGSG